MKVRLSSREGQFIGFGNIQQDSIPDMLAWRGRMFIHSSTIEEIAKGDLYTYTECNVYHIASDHIYATMEEIKP